MIEHIRYASILLTLGAICAAFGLASGPVRAQQDNEAKNAAQSENEFGFALLRSVDGGTGNAFISPLSIGQAMTMLYDGAGGATLDQIGRAMDFGDADSATINVGVSDLRTAIADADPSVELSIANALWADKHVYFRTAYEQECRSIFGAQATSLDFTNPSAADAINSWVSTNTKGKITSIVSAQSIQQAGAVLTDAVYFHGTWSHKFDPAKTQDGPFSLESGDTKQLPLMNQLQMFAATQNDQIQAVKLPYGNGRFTMVIVLPRPGVSLESVASALTDTSWKDLTTSMRTQMVDLTVPRFHIDYKTSLVAALKSLGITDAFDKHLADFSPMSETAMYVGAVEHKTTLDVDEAGTTATAATAVTMMPMMAMAPPSPPIVIRVDHPFICAIQDIQTGALLFIGAIRDPQEAK